MEIRRSYDRLISTMGFPILVRQHLYIESGPRDPGQYQPDATGIGQIHWPGSGTSWHVCRFRTKERQTYRLHRRQTAQMQHALHFLLTSRHRRPIDFEIVVLVLVLIDFLKWTPNVAVINLVALVVFLLRLWRTADVFVWYCCLSHWVW